MLDGGRKGDDGGKGDEGGKGDDYLEDDDDLEQVDDEDACSRLHLRRPLLIALLNDFYFGDRYARVVPICTWRDKNVILPCEFTTDQARLNASDVLA